MSDTEKMTNQVIPGAAVEAAARAAAKDEDASNWDDEHEHYRNGWRNRMQVGLEAAAPHMNRFIATTSELESLPSGAVIRDSDRPFPKVYERQDGGYFVAPGDELFIAPEDVTLPATVLYQP